MPVRATDTSIFRDTKADLRPESTRIYSGMEEANAAVSQENDIVNMISYLSRPVKAAPDPTFDFAARAHRSPFFNANPDAFSDINNSKDWTDVEARLAKENHNMQILASSGKSGIAWAIGASILSPTILLPSGFVRGASVGKIALKSSSWAVAGAGLQEMTIQLNQDERTKETSLLSLTGAAVVGAALGSVVGVMTRKEIDTLASYMAGTQSVRTISATPPSISSGKVESDFDLLGMNADERLVFDADLDEAGYAITKYPTELEGKLQAETPEGFITSIEREGRMTLSAAGANLDMSSYARFRRGEVEDAGAPLATIPPLDYVAARLGPIGRGLYQTYSDVLRFATGLFSQAGMVREGNLRGVASAPGGSIEAISHDLQKHYLRFRDEFAKLYKEYKLGGGKLSRGDFQKEASFTMWRQGQTEAGPALLKAAELIRTKGFGAYFEQANAAGLFEEGVIKDVDPWYMSQIPNRQYSLLHKNRMVNIVRKQIIDQLTQAADKSKSYADFRIQMAEDNIKILALDSEAAIKFAENVKLRTKALGTDFADVFEVDQNIKFLRQVAKDFPDLADDATADALELSTKHAERLGELNKARAIIKRQFAMLGRGRGSSARKAVAMALRMENLAEANVNTLYGVVAYAKRYLDKLATATPEVAEAELQKLVKQFNSSFAKAEKLLDRMNNLQGRMDMLGDALPPVKANQVRLFTTDGRNFYDNKDAAMLNQFATGKTGKPGPMQYLDMVDTSAKKALDSTSNVHMGQTGTHWRPTAAQAKKAQSVPLKQQTADELAAKKSKLVPEHEKRIKLLEAQIEKIRKQKSVDVVSIKAAIDAELDIHLRAVAETMQRRAASVARIEDRLEKVSPEAVEKTIKGQLDIIQDAKAKHVAWLEKDKKSTVIDFDQAPDFHKMADQDAQEFVNSMLGEVGRSPGVQYLMRHGPEKARRVAIDPMRDWGDGDGRWADFLENDADVIVRSYAKTIGGDLSVYKHFGTINPMSKGSKLYDDLEEEFTMLERAVPKELDKAGNPLSQKAQDKKMRRLRAVKKNGIKDLEALVERARHIRGAPEDPESFWYRAGAAFRNLNTMRLMGMVVPASFSDPAAIILKAGMMRTVKYGLVPMITNFKKMKLTAQQLQRMGIVTEIQAHHISRALSETMNEQASGTRVEKGLSFGAQHMGLLAGYDYWNQGMKIFAGAIEGAMIVELLQKVATGKARPFDIAELAAINIDSDLGARIWSEITLTSGGGNQIDEIWMPNTEAWTDLGAKEGFERALTTKINSTIVTPGFERPRWTDVNGLGKMLAQFRSYTFSSTYQSLMHNAQTIRHGGMDGTKAIPGFSMALALGALSYYTWAMSAGRKYQTEMENAPIEKWVDEAISRSGLLGVFAEIQRGLSQNPDLPVTFSDRPLQARNARGLTGMVGGPTYGLAQEAADIFTQALSPTQSTLESAGNMMPLQNHVLLRRFVFDPFVKGTGNVLGVPERRSNK